MSKCLSRYHTSGPPDPLPCHDALPLHLFQIVLAPEPQSFGEIRTNASPCHESL